MSAKIEMSLDRIREAIQDHKKWTKKDISGVRANLSGQNLSGLKLKGVILSHAILKNVRFNNADLRDGDLSFSHISGSTFDGAELRGADFSCSDMKGVDLSEVDLAGCVVDQVSSDYEILAVINDHYKYSIVLLNDRVTIGKTTKRYREWKKFTEADLPLIDQDELFFMFFEKAIIQIAKYYKGTKWE